MATTEEATPATETIPVTTVTVTEPTTTTSPQKNTTLAYRVNRKIGMCKTWLPLLYPPPQLFAHHLHLPSSNFKVQISKNMYFICLCLPQYIASLTYHQNVT
jgi:hypothetical protein